jgi:hypothetical protein
VSEASPSTPASSESPQSVDRALTLDEFERSIVVPRIESFIGAAADAGARAAFTELRDAAADGVIATHLQSRLGSVIDVALASGVVRRESGPAAANALAALYRRTPQGRQIGDSLDAINNALGALAGHTIEAIGVTMRSPGVYALKLRTGQVEIVISLAPAGASVESLEVAID